ncbi:MAG: MmcQ/YjbR family DNA-binding protein [Balneolaceae bacterium]
MNIEEYRDFCLSFAGVSEGFPFGSQTLVFKVMGKMFALTDIDTFEFINLKCDPERAIILREQYEEIKPGWHMSKIHWNSVFTHGTLDDEFIKELIIHSYDIIISGLPKKKKDELNSLR